VLDGGVSYQDTDCEILRDAFDPTALSNRFQPKRNRFVEALGGNFCGVLDSFGVSDGDAARPRQDVLAVGVAEAGRRLGLSPRTIATLISQRELPSRKVGRRRIIPVAALQAFLRQDHRTGQGRDDNDGR
jgi:excisionase family DNA binding protein